MYIENARRALHFTERTRGREGEREEERGRERKREGEREEDRKIERKGGMKEKGK